jgi:hypothetical protein
VVVVDVVVVVVTRGGWKQHKTLEHAKANTTNRRFDMI